MSNYRVLFFFHRFKPRRLRIFTAMLLFYKEKYCVLNNLICRDKCTTEEGIYVRILNREAKYSCQKINRSVGVERREGNQSRYTVGDDLFLL